MNKLLEEAKKHTRVHKHKARVPITHEEVELVLAYLRSEITLRGYAAAMKLQNPGNVSHRIGAVLLKAIQDGDIEIRRI
jgi:hypothetical protein